MEYDNLLKRQTQEMRELERKFEPLFAGVCAARRAIVTGEVDPVEGAGGAGGVAGIPEFWLQAIKGSKVLSEFVEEHDVPVLKFLTDITTAYVGDLAGFRLDFYFAPNPFFENAVLTKTFHIPKLVQGAPPAPKAAGAEAKEGEVRALRAP